VNTDTHQSHGLKAQTNSDESEKGTPQQCSLTF
jgi:hypothetical protein